MCSPKRLAALAAAVLCLVLTLAACGGDQQVQPTPTPAITASGTPDSALPEATAPNEWAEVRELEGALILEVREDHPEEDSLPALYMHLETEKIYLASNYRIGESHTIRDDAIRVDIRDIHIGQVRATTLGPAQAEFPLGIEDGDYELSIIWSSQEDRYTLRLTPESIELIPMRTSFTRAKSARYYRFPPNSFAYYCGTMVEDKHICADFYDLLDSRLELQEFTFPGDGTWPYPSQSEGHYYDMPGRFFVYQKDLDFEKAGELLAEFTQETLQVLEGAGLHLVDWRNRHARSWLIQPADEKIEPEPQ